MEAVTNSTKLIEAVRCRHAPEGISNTMKVRCSDEISVFNKVECASFCGQQGCITFAMDGNQCSLCYSGNEGGSAEPIMPPYIKMYLAGNIHNSWSFITA